VSRIAILSRKLRNFWELVGVDSSVELRPRQDAMPVVVVGDLRDPLETDVLDLSGGISTISQAGAAGNNSHTQLFNPAASGKIVLVEGVYVIPTTANSVRLCFHNTALTTGGSSHYRDRRLALQGLTPVAQTRSQNNAAILGTQGPVWNVDPTIEANFIPLEVILGPGQGCIIVNNAQNDGLTTCFFWTEQLEP
jgi:hypothetical protein